MKLKKLTRHGTIFDRLTIHNPPDTLCQELRSKLTFRNPKYDAACRYSPWGPPKGISPEIRLYEHSTATKRIGIPRGTDYETLLSKKAWKQFNQIKWNDLRLTSSVNMPKPLISLNTDQKTLVGKFDTALKTSLRPFDTYFSVSGTGTGKCIAQAMMAHRTGQKTLILVNTNLIKKAWLDDLHMLFGLDVRTEIGIIQQSRFKLGEHFTIAMIQTLGRRKHAWRDIFKEFGTVILDEADIVKGDTVSEIILNCPCKYVIGASATDDASTDMGFMLPCLLGTPIERIEISNQNTMTSMALTDVIEHRTKFRFSVNDSRDFDYNEMLEEITYDDERNEQVIVAAVKDWKAGHSVIVASNRMLHIEILRELAEVHGVTRPAILTGETNVDRSYTNDLIRDILKRKQRFVIASVDAVKRGANINPMNRLHLASPVFNKTTLEQLIGRIRRTYPKKSDCILHIYLDVKTPYAYNKYKSQSIPVFQKLKVKKFMNKLIV